MLESVSRLRLLVSLQVAPPVFDFQSNHPHQCRPGERHHSAVSYNHPRTSQYQQYQLHVLHKNNLNNLNNHLLNVKLSDPPSPNCQRHDLPVQNVVYDSLGRHLQRYRHEIRHNTYAVPRMEHLHRRRVRQSVCGLLVLRFRTGGRNNKYVEHDKWDEWNLKDNADAHTDRHGC